MATTSKKKISTRVPCGCRENEHAEEKSIYQVQQPLTHLEPSHELIFRIARLEAVERKREQEEIDAAFLAERKRANAQWYDGFLYGAVVGVWTIVLINRIRNKGGLGMGFFR